MKVHVTNGKLTFDVYLTLPPHVARAPFNAVVLALSLSLNVRVLEIRP